ncbi:hypothetical protein QQS21_003639 [Conoideocrella luteorostrata]|uniref:RNase III domain-containing protein n=1 Tax=Conoideocrella luteorostrata TaxID=1105319 RepID=A0AAJ0FW60_9HYPO|nr:hypothetical protein QQS21_003639 [Conoideocrella luteorostrata]
MGKRQASSLESYDNDEVHGSKRRHTHAIPHTTPWTSSEISGLPPLPKIHDAELEKTVFRHPGLSEFGPSYERLEWLGDAYLELISTSLIFQTFQSTPSGRCSQIREQLVRNTNLSGYFREYGLDAKAQLPADVHTFHGRGKSNDKDIIKIQADMFEAYVAAAIISDPVNGMTNTVSWLKALFGRTIKHQIVAYEKTQMTTRQIQTTLASESGVDADDAKKTVKNLNAKDQLRAEIGAKGVDIRYEDMPGPRKDKHSGLPLFTVGVYLDGWGEQDKLLGYGTALGKKEAGQKAAMRAMENKKLIKVYQAKKAAFKEDQKLDPDGLCS